MAKMASWSSEEVGGKVDLSCNSFVSKTVSESRTLGGGRVMLVAAKNLLATSKG